MKKLLILIILLVATNCFAEDRVKVQVQFRKLIFQCQDGTEEVIDASMSGGNTYEHTCKDGKWTNKFVNYSGNVSYTPEEYEALKEADLIAQKTSLVDDFIYQKNNPPKYVEPTSEEIQAQIDSIEEQKAVLVSQKESILAKELIEKEK